MSDMSLLSPKLALVDANNTIINEALAAKNEAFSQAESENNDLTVLSNAENNGCVLPCYAKASFATQKDAHNALNSFGRLHEYSVVVARSKKNKKGDQITKVFYECDRHGDLQNTSGLTEETRKRKKASSWRGGCPMKVNVKHDPLTGSWWIQHTGQETIHNHPPSILAESHPTYRRHLREANPNLLQRIITDSLTGTKARATKAALYEEDKDVLITSRDIYNIRQAQIKKTLGNMFKIEHLMTQLQDEEQYFHAAQYDESAHLTKLFLAYRPAITVFKPHPDVILMDCTYKTNRYSMPLLNIIGITGMGTMIHLANCFLDSESEADGYTFAITHLKRLLTKFEIPEPRLILTDLCLALLNVVEPVRK